MVQRNISEAKAQLSALLELVAQGEDVVIGKAGKPVARIIPYIATVQKRIPGALKGKIWISEDFDQTSPELIRMMEEGPI